MKRILLPLLAVFVDLDFLPGAPEGVLGGAGEEEGFPSRRGGNAGGGEGGDRGGGGGLRHGGVAALGGGEPQL